MNRPFERIAVVGLGLLGGSVALAARERGLADRVAGSARQRSVRTAAVARGAVDEAGDAPEAVAGADLVVLATPVSAMPGLVRRIAPALRDGALVTDVGSVKGFLEDLIPGLLPPGSRFVGSHPMAGSHERGFARARGDLFEGAPCVVTGLGDSPAVRRVVEFWSALGARVVLRDSAAHDREVAWTSHVPHVLAFAFARALEDAPAGAREVIGSGFRDFTRIARSDPGLWADILVANRKALAAPLEAVSRSLAGLARAVDSEDIEAVLRWIASARNTLVDGFPDPDAADSSPRRDGGADRDTHPQAPGRREPGKGAETPTHE